MLWFLNTESIYICLSTQSLTEAKETLRTSMFIATKISSICIRSYVMIYSENISLLASFLFIFKPNQRTSSIKKIIH